MIGISLGYVAVYVALAGVASFIESPVGQRFRALQLNALIRVGSLAAAVIALVASDDFVLPATRSVLAGLGVGLLTGVGSFFYCFGLDYMSVSLVVTFSNLYVVITTLLGIVVLGEPLTVLTITGLSCTLAGVVLLTHTPARYGVDPKTRTGKKAPSVRGLAIMAGYIVVIGVGAFLEKPALHGLDATQLNCLMAIAMTAVAIIALASKGPRLPMTKSTLAAVGVGAMIGIASVFYFLGLRGLPVSVAAATSNVYVVITVVLSSIFLRQPLTRARSGAIALTLLGVTQLALSAP